MKHEPLNHVIPPVLPEKFETGKVRLEYYSAKNSAYTRINGRLNGPACHRCGKTKLPKSCHKPGSPFAWCPDCW